MKRKSLGCAAAMLLAGLGVTTSAPAQTATDRTVELFTCKDVMREPNTSREVAIAFLHGYRFREHEARVPMRGAHVSRRVIDTADGHLPVVH